MQTETPILSKDKSSIFKMMKLRCLFIFLLAIVGMSASAQTTYPIQVNANLLPPYSLYLSDYYSGTREKIAVTLVNRDQLKPTLSVRLRMIISAAGGVRLQTNDNVFFEPIIVENGLPLRLTASDLAPYFQPNNLITQGSLPSGRLPEGLVEFCFQAVEAYTGQVLSSSSCARAWVTSQKPPLLSLPRDKESIAFRDPLNVLFQWTPLHQGISQVEYEFILKEYWDNGMPPQAAFPYSPEIYRETTRSTSIIYGALNPPLLPGKRYIWCVRAQARDGIDPVNLFLNEGYSEVRTFTLQDNCGTPTYILATAERSKLTLEWSGLPEHVAFAVNYRLKTENNSESWTEQQTNDVKTILYSLKNGGVYEYRIGAMCIAGQPVFGPIMEVALPQEDSTRLANCGILPDVNIANKEPLKQLQTGEVIKAGDFPITITHVNGTNGTFTGKGWTTVPWLMDAKLAVEFTSIGVNTDRQLISGYIQSSYDVNEGGITDLDEVFEGGGIGGTVITGLSEYDTTFNFAIPGIESFTLNEEGDLVIVDDQKQPHVVDMADREGQGNEGNNVKVFPMTVKDKDGKVYKVDEETVVENGQEVKKAKATLIGHAGQPLTAGSFDPGQLDSDKAVVTFEKGEGYYSFDTWQEYYANAALIREKYQKLDDNYYAPWKFMLEGKTDVVRARIQIKDSSIKAKKVIFKTPLGAEFAGNYDSIQNVYNLTLISGPVNDVQEIYALYPKTSDSYYTLGKINVATYPGKSYSVTLVSVNNAAIDQNAIQETLNKTYGPVGVTWQVTQEILSYTGNVNVLNESTGLQTYNDDMRALNAAAKAQPWYKKDSNILFFIDPSGSEKQKRDAAGFMPRGAQFGYIFPNSAAAGTVDETVAHELGHGRWKLIHTFDKHYGGYATAATDNLMDYNNGLHLAKWQWDLLNDPSWLMHLFDGDEEDMSAVCQSSLTAIEAVIRSGEVVTFMRLLSAVHEPDGEFEHKGKKYKVSKFENDQVLIHYYHDAYDDPTIQMFHVNVKDEQLLSKGDQKFWIYYHDNSFSSGHALATVLTMTVLLKDVKPDLNEPMHCQRKIRNFPYGVTAGAAFSNVASAAVFYTAFGWAGLEAFVANGLAKCGSALAVDVAFQIAINSLVKRYLGEEITAGILLKELSAPSAGAACITATFFPDCGMRCAGLTGLATGFADDLVKQLYIDEKSIDELDLNQTLRAGFIQGLIAMGTQKVISFGLNKWNQRYTRKQVEEAIEDARINPEKYGLPGQGGMPTQGVDFSDVVISKNYELAKDLIAGVVSKVDDNLIDVVVHGAGNEYSLVEEGLEAVGPVVLANWIASKGIKDQTIRLLSCSSLESAQQLAKELQQKVIACEGKIKIFSDGGIESMERSPWFELSPDGSKIPVDGPPLPVNKEGKFVELGKDAGEKLANAGFGKTLRASLSKLGVSDDVTQYSIAQNSRGGAWVLLGTTLEAKEIALADDIFRVFGQKCIFPKSNLQAIEGFLADGTPFTMKELEKNFNSFAARINEMSSKIKADPNFQWLGAEGYLKVPFSSFVKNDGTVQTVTKEYVEQLFDASISRNAFTIKNDGTVKAITVFLYDGSSFILDLNRLKP
ncbi:hypothetical protein [Pseudochryseolinea flava]|uniref:Fibronectin type-III domain-containing protein n=1 Tax=Pseudochryseolinea flava TaxID=2059302 RepID=A0A364XU25_9BACT|nr:hypothetical protein [Pseudochryseolinea flava]RAV97752.1 hypothetical protein DQQ10_27035 [Pseudochryseolinea flava]